MLPDIASTTPTEISRQTEIPPNVAASFTSRAGAGKSLEMGHSAMTGTSYCSVNGGSPSEVPSYMSASSTHESLAETPANSVTSQTNNAGDGSARDPSQSHDTVFRNLNTSNKSNDVNGTCS